MNAGKRNKIRLLIIPFVFLILLSFIGLISYAKCENFSTLANPSSLRDQNEHLEHQEESDYTHKVMKLVFQLAFILLVAKISGEVCERFLKQPAVLGEIAAGVIIGPYALGGIISLPGMGVLFPSPGSASSVSTIPVSIELWSVAQIAAVILLFLAGIETDLRAFIRYGFRASVVAVGGVVFPFIFGLFATVWMGYDDSYLGGHALFMGAIMVATSVGITARVLSDIKKLDTPEGVTILGAAVVDDILGIIVLTVVIGLLAGGGFSMMNVAIVGGKAIGFWLVLTFGGIALSVYISRFIKWFNSPGAIIPLALFICYFASALAESFGLAMIIGAYSIGLAFSKSEIAEELEEKLSSVYHAFVPIFFVVMGMLVDVGSIFNALWFGIVITILAIIGKVLGCSLPALSVGFNMRGAERIGFGMLPRGEVALIVAGVGLAAGIIDNTIFGVSILMTVVTTFLAPIFLVSAFKRGGSGNRVEER